MFKFVVILTVTMFALASAAPKAKPSVAVAAPLFAAPAVVTAQSSQVIARQYNALAAPLVAPAPVIAAPVARAAHLVAPAAAPILASPYYASPYAASYLASPYAVNPYAAPLVF